MHLCKCYLSRKTKQQQLGISKIPSEGFTGDSSTMHSSVRTGFLHKNINNLSYYVLQV